MDVINCQGLCSAVEMNEFLIEIRLKQQLAQVKNEPHQVPHNKSHTQSMVFFCRKPLSSKLVKANNRYLNLCRVYGCRNMIIGKRKLAKKAKGYTVTHKAHSHTHTHRLTGTHAVCCCNHSSADKCFGVCLCQQSVLCNFHTRTLSHQFLICSHPLSPSL